MFVQCIESNDILTVEIYWANQKLHVPNAPFLGLMDRWTSAPPEKNTLKFK